MTKAEERRAYLQAQSATQPQINIQPTQTITKADQRRLELQQAQQPVVQQTTSMADKLRSGARLTPEETIQAAVEMGKISPEEGQKRLNVVSKAPLDQAIIQTQTEINDDIKENNLLGKVNSKKYFEYQNKLEKAKEDGNIVKETAYQNLLDKMDETYKPMTKDWYNIKKPNTDQLKSSLENSVSSVKWMEKKLLDSQTADEQNKNIKLYEQAYDYYNKALKEYQDALLYERYNRNPILAELDILGYTGANSMANIIEGTGRDIKNSHESLYGYGYDNINAEELIKQNEISKTAQDEKSRIMQGINPSINALRQQANKKDANDEIKNLYQQIMTGTFNGTAKDIQTILDNAKDKSSTFQARENVERKLQHKKEKFDWEYEPSDITKELLGGLEQVAAMIPTQAATMINPTLGDVAIYQRTGNPAYNKARAEGATSSQAEANKTLKGSLEAALEHFMTSSIDKAVGRTGLIAPSEWAEHIANPWLRTGTAAVVDMVSEGVEEIPSTVLDPIIDRITYNPDAPLATAEDIWGAFTESMLPTAIMLGVGGTIQAVETYANNATNKVNNSPLSELKKAELINQIENGKKELLKQINARANEINQNSLNETTNNQIAKDTEALNLQPAQTASQNVLNNNNISLVDKVTELNKQGYSIPKSTADILQTIQNQRGVTINFDANVKGNGAYNEATRTITLNPNSNRAIEFTTVHELAHDLKAGNMEDYTSLQNTVLDYARKNPNFLNAIESLDQTYKNEIGKGNYNINDEATNDILAEAIGNQEFLNSLAQEKPNLFQRIYNWFKNVLFDGNKSGLTLEQRRTLNKMEQGFRNAYQKAFNGVQQEGIQSVNNVKNSLSEAETDDRTLAATHNLTRDKLKGILELGGFPVPSIAISDVNKLTPTQFGDITVLFDKDTIDPTDRRNEVYDRDVWSPTFPDIDYDINNADIKKYITQNLEYDRKDGIIDKAITNYLYDTNLSDKIKRRGIDGTIEEIKNSPIMQYLYKTSVEKGEYTPKYKEQKYSNYHDNDTLKRFIEIYNKNHEMPLYDFFYHYINYGDMEMTDEQRNEINNEIKEALRPELEDYYKKHFDKNAYKDKPELKNYVRQHIEEELNQEVETYGKFYDFIMNSAQLEKNGVGQTIDEDATLEDIGNHIDKQNYEKWVDDTFGEMLNNATKGIRNDKDPYTNNGRRSWKQLHDEYNLGNVVKTMTKGQTKAGEGAIFGGGFGDVQAMAADRFNSIEDIRNAKGRLTTSQEANQMLEPVKEEIQDRITELSKYSKNDSDWFGIGMGAFDRANDAITEFAGRKNLTVGEFKKVLRKYPTFDVNAIPNDVLQNTVNSVKKLKEIYTDYFEAKPQRAVGFEEIASVLIPNDLAEDTKQQLRDRGINYVEYDPTIEGDRETKYREAAQDVLFSKSNTSWQQFLDNTYGKWNTGTRTNFESLPSNEELQQQETKSIENEPIVQMSENKKTKKLEDIANSTPENVKQRPMEYTQRKDKNTPNQRKFFDNVETSPIIANETKNQVNATTYEQQKNLDTLEEVRQSLDERGNDLVEEWKHKMKNFTAKDVALGAILVERYQQNGDWQSAARTVEKLADMGTEAGRAVQMYSIFQRLSPETMAIYQQKELNKAFEEMKQRKTGKWVEANQEKFKLTPDETQFIYEQVEKASQAIDDETKQRELSKIENMINNKLPPEAGQSIKALRRIAMLFNPKTQVRNIVGNTLIMPVNDVADLVGAAIDRAIARKTGVRTTSVPNIATKAKGGWKGLKDAKTDYKTGTRTVATGNKYEFEIGAKPFNENTGSKAKNTVARGLNALNDLLSAVMSGGDRPFYEAAYQNSLQGQMKANKVTEATPEMEEIARTEGMQRTWNDDNNYTKTVLSIRKAMNNINIKGFGLGDLIIPFAKTPANLTKAMVEYSPAGFIESVIDFNDMRKAISRGEMTPMQQKKFVASTSKAIAGSMLYLIAGTLAKSGKITGSADDDKDVKNFEQNVLGIQPYSVRIGDKTYTYSWANPINAPLAIMADTYKMSKENASKWDILNNAFKVAGETLVDNSFLQGIKELFSKDSISEGIVEAIESFPESMIPTFLSQIASLNDSKQRQTFEYQNDLQTIANKIKNKIPGLRNTLEPQVNTFGEEIENQNNAFNAFLSPANVREARITDEQKALYDVYQETKDKTIFPMQAPYYVSDNGEKRNLTSKERVDYQKASGNYVNEVYDGLFNQEDVFNNNFHVQGEGKVKILKKIAEDGNTKGKEAVGVTTKTTDSLNEKIDALQDAGIPLADYYLMWYHVGAGEDKKNNTKKNAINETIRNLDHEISTDQKKVLYEIFNVK